MRKRIAVGIAGTVLVLAVAYTPHADPKTVNVREAETAAWAAVQRLEPTCKARGMAAEAWAEVNSQKPEGYEVIGQCVGVRP